MVATRASRAAAAAAPRKPRAKSPGRRPAARKKSPARRKVPAKKPFHVRDALTRALGGGLPGAVAMVLQVVLLMWLRTAVNYQMRHGGSLAEVTRILYAEGGVRRFYAGAQYALLQGPLSRFGDTAANAGVLYVLNGSTLPILAQTACASAGASLWRLVIAPLDTAKTMLQVHGADGLNTLLLRVQSEGIGVLWAGALGSIVATFLGHYPWFATNNYLETRIAQPKRSKAKKLMRRALIGFASSVVADCISNSTRVVKTTVQTSLVPLTYVDAALQVVDRDGLAGLLWRGLAAKILCNGLSSILFSVAWKGLMDRQAKVKQ